MKKLSVLFVTMLLALFSCSSGGDDSGQGNGDSVGGFENPDQATNINTQKPYTGSSNVYMAEAIGRESGTGELIWKQETMLLAGTMDNGKITFNLPEDLDSRFLMKFDEAPPGMKIEPLGVEVLIYTDPLRLMDSSSKHIGDIRYIKQDGAEYQVISYWYFSKEVKMNGTIEGTSIRYEVNAKKGWNKIYWSGAWDKPDLMFATTDLSKVPKGLEWIVEVFGI